MVGILTDSPDCLKMTDLIGDAFLSSTLPGEVYESGFYEHPLLYSFTYGTPYQASASVQALVDEGCTLLIYLSGGIVKKPSTPIYALDFVCSSPWKLLERKNQYVGFIDKNVEKSAVSGDKDSDLPVNEMLVGIMSTCLVNDIPILVLLDRVETLEDVDYDLLGSLVRKKINNIIRTDYETNGDEDEPPDVFMPIQKLNRIVSLVGKGVDDES